MQDEDDTMDDADGDLPSTLKRKKKKKEKVMPRRP